MAEFCEVMTKLHTMCEYYHYDICIGCPLSSDINVQHLNCRTYIEQFPNSAESIILNWTPKPIDWLTLKRGTLLTIKFMGGILYDNFHHYENGVVYCKRVVIEQGSVIQITPQVEETESEKYEPY